MNRLLRLPLIALTVTGGVVAMSAPAAADFHQMQIQQILLGVGGDTSIQAIQMRTLQPGQVNVHQAIIRVYDAEGANPIDVVSIPSIITTGARGSKILIASPNFPAATNPTAVPDFTMTNLIPESYLAAGSLTWENEALNLVWWRLSWGGAAYTGDTTGEGLNDDDIGIGEFGPPWPDSAPSAGIFALRFLGPPAGSTSNDLDYAMTTEAAIFRNNANEIFTVTSPTSVALSDLSVMSGVRFAPNPFRSTTRLEFRLARAARTQLVITDVAGRRVARVEAALSAGEQTIDWAGRDETGSPLTAGVYFYRLTADNDEQTGKVVVLR